MMFSTGTLPCTMYLSKRSDKEDHAFASSPCRIRRDDVVVQGRRAGL